jgi:arsenate reductase (thioredoxin)
LGFALFHSASALIVRAFRDVSAERCPIFPGAARRVHWSFPDPSALTGRHESRMRGVREIWDILQQKVQQWCDTVCPVREMV